ncbi:hypothetical protein B0H17DRAFT_1147463 [Mycena rosella]|uniref:Uncharacterized protein n=1 Tax=Mycena rosella TaxID=1033263 RepID=A0AAD7CLS5_MYCRO|nr:hypothetical protein B0H17DRAFT_1147463 [Mycena rosella]
MRVTASAPENEDEVVAGRVEEEGGRRLQALAEDVRLGQGRGAATSVRDRTSRRTWVGLYVLEEAGQGEVEEGSVCVEHADAGRIACGRGFQILWCATNCSSNTTEADLSCGKRRQVVLIEEMHIRMAAAGENGIQARRFGEGQSRGRAGCRARARVEVNAHLNSLTGVQDDAQSIHKSQNEYDDLDVGKRWIKPIFPIQERRTMQFSPFLLRGGRGRVRCAGPDFTGRDDNR